MIKKCELCKKEFQSSPCEKRIFCSRKCYGHIRGLRMKGNKIGFQVGFTPWNKGKKGVQKGYWAGKNRVSSLQNEKHPGWKGENVSYISLHQWVGRKLGTPSKCEHCNKEGFTKQQINWANKSHEYKRDLTDWLRLCVSCHRRYDISFKLSHKI